MIRPLFCRIRFEHQKSNARTFEHFFKLTFSSSSISASFFSSACFSFFSVSVRPLEGWGDWKIKVFFLKKFIFFSVRGDAHYLFTSSKLIAFFEKVLFFPLLFEKKSIIYLVWLSKHSKINYNLGFFRMLKNLHFENRNSHWIYITVQKITQWW